MMSVMALAVDSILLFIKSLLSPSELNGIITGIDCDTVTSRLGLAFFNCLDLQAYLYLGPSEAACQSLTMQSGRYCRG